MANRSESPVTSGSPSDLPFTSPFEDQPSRVPCLRTFNSGLDQFLGDRPFPMGSLTEICGEAGSGKSQWCLHLCAVVQLPASMEGLEGSAVYLDTEGSFNGVRMRQMADATRNNALTMLEQAANCQSDVQKLRERNFMDNILYKRIENVEGLLSTLDDLEQRVLSRMSNVKLIVLDSIAYPFRYIMDEDNWNVEKQTPIFFQIAQKLNRMADHFDLAVVIANQMTTKFRGSDEGVLVPALGDAWSYIPHQRVQLSRHPIKSEFRVAKLIKSSVIDCQRWRRIWDVCAMLPVCSFRFTFQ